MSFIAIFFLTTDHLSLYDCSGVCFFFFLLKIKEIGVNIDFGIIKIIMNSVKAGFTGEINVSNLCSRVSKTDPFEPSKRESYRLYRV